jgi:alkylation response protein AidB-like acyl-CoA dehydrogenase
MRPSPPDVGDLPSPRLSHLLDITRALAAHAAENDRTGDFPAQGIQITHDAGLLTFTAGGRHGLADTVRVLTALGQGDPSVALIGAMTIFSHTAAATWPADIYAEVLAESARRPTLINSLRVEPELGTPARGGLPATTARRTADGWELTGHKIFSTGAVALRWMQVWARTDEDLVRAGAFLVRTDSPGITVDRTWSHLGLRASRSDDVTFDRVRVPYEATIFAADPGGLRAWNALGLGAIYLGVARSARDWLTRYLNERTPTNLGQPLASLPRFQSEVGEIELALLSASTLVDSLAAAVDRGETVDANLGKTAATRAAIDAVQRAVALIGNAALTQHHPLERHLRDVLCGRIHTPQDDVVLTSAGRTALERTT